MNTKIYILILSALFSSCLTFGQTTTTSPATTTAKEHRKSILSSHKKVKKKTAAIANDTVPLAKKRQYSKQIGRELKNAHNKQDSLYATMSPSEKAEHKANHEKIQSAHKKAIQQHKLLDQELSRPQPDSSKVKAYNDSLQKTIDISNKEYEQEKYPEVF